MNKEQYKTIVDKHTPKEPRLWNVIVAFFVGGFVGFMGEFSVYILKSSFGMSGADAFLWTALIILGIAVFLTALGFFDNWVSSCKCGLIIPTTGFAHSVASSAMDYKNDGLITGLGSNFFKLAGSVILYGIISAFILVIVRVVIGG